MKWIARFFIFLCLSLCLEGFSEQKPTLTTTITPSFEQKSPQQIKNLDIEEKDKKIKSPVSFEKKIDSKELRLTTEHKKEVKEVQIKKEVLLTPSSQVQTLEIKNKSILKTLQNSHKKIQQWPCSMVVTKATCERFKTYYFKKFESSYSISYLYNKSKSNFSHRDYEIKAPGVNYQLAFWASPFIGFFGSYYYTMTGNIPIRTPYDHKKETYNDIKPLRMKRFKFGVQARTPITGGGNDSYLILKLAYTQEELDAKEALGRISIESKGIETGLEAYIFITEKYTTDVGIHTIYDVSYDEYSQENILSGSDGEIYKVNAFLGGGFSVGLNHKIFWRMNFQSNNILYKGSTNVADPENGKKINGVSISDNHYLFQLGYSIGH